MSIIPIPIFFPRESNEDKKERLRLKRIGEISRKKIPTMDEENEKRVLMKSPHLLEIVKERCPKCKGKMWHDNFQKCWNKKKHLLACYQCIDCKYRVLFDLFTQKFEKRPFSSETTGDAK